MAKTPANNGADAATLIEARVLIDCDFGPCNTVATFATEIEAKQAESAGLVDLHPDAVAYAKSVAGPSAEPVL